MASRKPPSPPCWLIVTLELKGRSPGARHIDAQEMAAPTPVPHRLATRTVPFHRIPCVSLPLSQQDSEAPRSQDQDEGLSPESLGDIAFLARQECARGQRGLQSLPGAALQPSALSVALTPLEQAGCRIKMFRLVRTGGCDLCPPRARCQAWVSVLVGLWPSATQTFVLLRRGNSPRDTSDFLRPQSDLKKKIIY